jgi:hypothetical protein
MSLSQPKLHSKTLSQETNKQQQNYTTFSILASLTPGSVEEQSRERTFFSSLVLGIEPRVSHKPGK